MRWSVEFNAGMHPTREVDWRRVRRLYAGDVATDDELFGEFLWMLRKEGFDANTVLIVTSDHGENLGEHGFVGHQFSAHETLLSVPLVVRAPGRLASGVRSDPVMLTDLFATTLDLAGVRGAPIPAQSRSLVASPLPVSRPLVAEAARPHRSILELLLQANPKFDTRPLEVAYRTVRIGSLRLTEGDDGTEQLNDMTADPRQERNLAAERPADVRALKAVLDLQVSGHGAGAPQELKLDAQTREKLRALGYVR
jgi:arylsulfatase A-like enzyme